MVPACKSTLVKPSNQPTWENFINSPHLSANMTDRITRDVLKIKHHWKQDWREQLRLGGINIQGKPCCQLANTLAQLAGYESDIHRLFTFSPDSRAFQRRSGTCPKKAR